MHRYRTVAQISLIFSILNLVFAAPIVVQEIRDARGDEKAVAKDVAAMPTASDRPTSPGLSPDAMGSPQHLSLSDGSTSSGYPSPYLSYLSSDESVSGYAWTLNRRPRLNLYPPASLHGPASLHPSSSGPSMISLPAWLYELTPERPPSPASLHGSASAHHSSSGSSVTTPSPPVDWQGLEPLLPHASSSYGPEMPPSSPSWASEMPPSPVRWQLLAELPYSSSPHASEIMLVMPPSPQFPEPDYATADTYSPQDRFTPSRHSSLSSSTGPSFAGISWHWYPDEPVSTPYTSASGGSLSSHYLTASEGSMPSLEPISGGSVPSHHSMPEGLVPSLTPDGSPPSPSSPPTETPPDNAEFFDKNMMKKLKIFAGMLIVGGTIAGILGSQIKHRDYQDS